MKNQKHLLCWLIIVCVVMWAEAGHASEPGGFTLILFFVGLIFAPIIQLLIYPILVASEAKPWTINAVGAASLTWGAFVGISLVGFIGRTYFCLTLLLFLVSYLKKTAKIEKMNAQSTKAKSIIENEEKS